MKDADRIGSRDHPFDKDREFDLPGVAQWLQANRSQLPEPPKRRGGGAFWRSAFWILGTAAVLLAWPRSSPGPIDSRQQTWDLEISADGDKPVKALVYGEGSGFHVITVPAQGTDAAGRQHIPIRPGSGNVHIVSLGRNGLSVKTKPPIGGPLISASGRARSITLFSNAERSGIRTGW